MNLEVIIAVGHTDSIGTDAYNQKLSIRRAEAVKAYLTGKGAAINYEFVDMTVEVPRETGPDARAPSGGSTAPCASRPPRTPAGDDGPARPGAPVR